MLFSLLLLLIFFNVYLAVDVTTVDVVIFATAAIVIVVTVAVTLITIDNVSLLVITVIIVALVPTIRTDVVCHTVIKGTLMQI